jgi:hypothetical protein
LLATEAAYDKVARILLSSGAFADSKDKNRRTPLSFFMELGNG